ncbi:caspase family protein [Aureispira anguillae]|uniref:Caspase family protein n=1 Tax=Aureispira anguillae TaxID=2864201 RepID=A0A915YDV5_9BACT|nr:caspase family protein [Aureispira anguillae]BDS11278.1 caspase family protein [Aureispira anguillae]
MKGMSLHVGLNYVDPTHYQGWDGKLNACEKDARDMEFIAASKGFVTSTLLREQASRDRVKNAIEEAAKTLEAGDIFYLSYSGHGGQLPDQNGDEPDGQDETWCLFDGQLVDDELKALWTEFKEGVRIFVTSDSCHSGSIIRLHATPNEKYTDAPARIMPSENALTTYMANRSFYDPILANIKAVDESLIKATVLLISGCQDNQSSYEGSFNGWFTRALKIVWNGGKFRGDYQQFRARIVDRLPDYQSPNFMILGKANPDFRRQTPFTI